MTTRRDYPLALAIALGRCAKVNPIDLAPTDAQAAIDHGHATYDAIQFKDYVYWLLSSTGPDTREAVRLAYLTLGERVISDEGQVTSGEIKNA